MLLVCPFLFPQHVPYSTFHTLRVWPSYLSTLSCFWCPVKSFQSLFTCKFFDPAGTCNLSITPHLECLSHLECLRFASCQFIVHISQPYNVTGQMYVQIILYRSSCMFFEVEIFSPLDAFFTILSHARLWTCYVLFFSFDL